MEKPAKELTNRLKNGDKKAFEEIYEAFYDKIYFFCLKFGVAKMDAEEITQEVFVKLWLNRASLKEEKNLHSYLFKISQNIIIDGFKEKIKTQAKQTYQMNLFVPRNDVEEKMDYRDLKTQLEEMLTDLPERRREVFELSRLKGLSHKEIALELGISTKTVENHLNHALSNFRSVLRKTNVFVYSMLFLELLTQGGF